MANILYGKKVADFIDAESLALRGNKRPTLAIFKVGNENDDSSYEKSILNKISKLGITTERFYFEKDVDPSFFYNKLFFADNNKNIDAILILRPLPFDEKDINKYLSIRKDVDACTDLALASCFLDNDIAFKPCTAEAVMALLKYYHIDLLGKKVAVLGRSKVIGKPVSMLLLRENATVTIIHHKSENIKDICKNADILISAIGQMEFINKDYVNKNQTVIDVGINYNSLKHKICGDVLFEEIEPIVKNITPVPGGIGTITTSVLLNHVIKASSYQN